MDYWYEMTWYQYPIHYSQSTLLRNLKHGMMDEKNQGKCMIWIAAWYKQQVPELVYINVSFGEPATWSCCQIWDVSLWCHDIETWSTFLAHYVINPVDLLAKEQKNYFVSFLCLWLDQKFEQTLDWKMKWGTHALMGNLCEVNLVNFCEYIILLTVIKQ